MRATPYCPSTRSVATSATHRTSEPARPPAGRRPRPVGSRRPRPARSSAAVVPPAAARRTAAARVGAGRPEPRADGRLVAQGELVGDRRAGEQPAGDDGQDPADGAPATSRGRRRAVPPEDSAGEPETGEQARPGQGEEPRVGRLERRQQGLWAAPGSWLRTPPIDGTRSSLARSPSQTIPRRPGPRGRPAARPRRQGDGDRQGGRRPDQDVDRAARPVAEQDVERRRGTTAPSARRRRDGARTSGRSRRQSSRRPGGAAARRRKYRPSGTMGHRNVPGPRTALAHRATPPDVTGADFPWATVPTREPGNVRHGGPAAHRRHQGFRTAVPGCGRGRRPGRSPRAGLARPPPRRGRSERSRRSRSSRGGTRRPSRPTASSWSTA